MTNIGGKCGAYSMESKAIKGFTLMELTIVLALLAIIAAVLIPMFLTTTDRARLRSDIQSARVIQNAMDLYRVERGRMVAGIDMAAVIQNLASAGYLDLTNATIQTEGAAWVLHPVSGVNRAFVDIGGSPDSVHRAYANLTEAERAIVRGGRAVSG